MSQEALISTIDSNQTDFKNAQYPDVTKLTNLSQTGVVYI